MVYWKISNVKNPLISKSRYIYKIVHVGNEKYVNENLVNENPVPSGELYSFPSGELYSFLYFQVNFVAAIVHGANAAFMAVENSKPRRDICFNFTKTGDFIPRWENSSRFKDSMIAHGAISIHWLIFSFHLLSFLFQMSVYLNRNAYHKWVGRAQNPLRFIEYSISASLMLVAIALFSGVPNTTALWNIALLCSFTQLMGLFAEQYLAKSRNYESVFTLVNNRTDVKDDNLLYYMIQSTFIIFAIVFVFVNNETKTFIKAIFIASVLVTIWRFNEFGGKSHKKHFREVAVLFHKAAWVAFALAYGSIWWYYFDAWGSVDDVDDEIKRIVHIIVVLMFLTFSSFGLVQVFQVYKRHFLKCRCCCSKTNTVCCGIFTLSSEKSPEKSPEKSSEKSSEKTVYIAPCFCKMCCKNIQIRDNDFAELLYAFLSLFAKTLLGWYIYANLFLNSAGGGKVQQEAYCGGLVISN